MVICDEPTEGAGTQQPQIDRRHVRRASAGMLHGDVPPQQLTHGGLAEPITQCHVLAVQEVPLVESSDSLEGRAPDCETGTGQPLDIEHLAGARGPPDAAAPPQNVCADRVGEGSSQRGGRAASVGRYPTAC